MNYLNRKCLIDTINQTDKNGFHWHFYGFTYKYNIVLIWFCQVAKSFHIDREHSIYILTYVSIFLQWKVCEFPELFLNDNFCCKSAYLNSAKVHSKNKIHPQLTCMLPHPCPFHNCVYQSSHCSTLPGASRKSIHSIIKNP